MVHREAVNIVKKFIIADEFRKVSDKGREGLRPVVVPIVRESGGIFRTDIGDVQLSGSTRRTINRDRLIEVMVSRGIPVEDVMSIISEATDETKSDVIRASFNPGTKLAEGFYAVLQNARAIWKP